MSCPHVVDEELFDRLFERHRSIVFGYQYGQTGRRQDASDLVQETFVRVWKNLNSIRDADEDHQCSLIMRIARSAAIDFRRREAVRKTVSVAMPDHCEPMTTNLESAVVDALAIDQVSSAVEALPAKYRTVLTLTVLSGLSSEEVGKLLGRPAATVRFQLAEARRRIARKVGL